jgi:hypothetical protein
VRVNMLEEYKELTFPSPAACKSDGRKTKYKSFARNLQLSDSKLLQTRMIMCEVYQTYTPMTCDAQAWIAAC